MVTTKKIVIENYIQHLASFLDENNIEWENLNNGNIAIYIKAEDGCHEEAILRLGFEFGKFYSDCTNNQY